MNGPDVILPSESLTTSAADGAVKLRDALLSSNEASHRSLPTFIKQSCEKYSSNIFFSVKRNGIWLKWSYKMFYEEVICVSKAFIKLGLERFHSVSIKGFNSPEWFLAYLGAIMAGGFPVGIYPTNSPDVTRYIMEDSRTNILVVENEKALNALWQYKDTLPYLKTIIQYIGEPPADKEGVISWKQLMQIGTDVDDCDLMQRQTKMAINQCAVLIYTSGTSGMPKGVMLSHDNILFTVVLINNHLGLGGNPEYMISYLPMSHVAAQMIDIWFILLNGSTIYFADKNALKGSLIETLKEVRPSIFFGVPRVFESIMQGLQQKGKGTKGLKLKIVNECKKAGIKRHTEGRKGLVYKLGNKVVYKKVRVALGLDRTKYVCSGAAPVNYKTHEYFMSLDIPILEMYGLTESTGAGCANIPNTLILSNVGKPVNGVKIMMVSNKKNDLEETELCMYGRNVMMGYLNQPRKTMEAIDQGGYLHSEDAARLDEDGFVCLTGRIKELLITDGGENIAPVPIEETIKEELACLSNVVVIGDKKKFLTAFLMFAVTVDPETDNPTSNLSPKSLDWCNELGFHNFTTVTEILQENPAKLMYEIQQGIDRANARAISNAARIRRWKILPFDISVNGGELGPTLKLKRYFFNGKYAKNIDDLYAN